MYDFLDGVASTEPSTWGVSPDIARAIWARYEGEGKNYLEHESALQFLEEVLTTIQPIQADEGMVPRPKSGDWGEWDTNKSCRGCDRPHCVRTGAERLLELAYYNMDAAVDDAAVLRWEDLGKIMYFEHPRHDTWSEDDDFADSNDTDEDTDEDEEEDEDKEEGGDEGGDEGRGLEEHHKQLTPPRAPGLLRIP